VALRIGIYIKEVYMANIQIFDPALCCSTGVCGVEVDQELVGFSADFDWAQKSGAQIARFNLAQQPMAFAEHAVVRQFLERSGAEALPLILIDGEIALAGRYPSRAELARWGAIPAVSGNDAMTNSAGCSGKSCC
jgi:hypothetical protein